jgi:hypothetical protein
MVKIFAQIQIKPVRPLMFMCRVLVLTALYVGVIQLKAELGGRAPDYVMDVLRFIPMLLWVQDVEGRLRDAGMPRWTMWPYFLVTCFGCIFLHLYHVVSGPATLVLFILLQVPLALMKSRAKSPSLP